VTYRFTNSRAHAGTIVGQECAQQTTMKVLKRLSSL
jgi:hypothetical protein